MRFKTKPKNSTFLTSGFKDLEHRLKIDPEIQHLNKVIANIKLEPVTDDSKERLELMTDLRNQVIEQIKRMYKS